MGCCTCCSRYTHQSLMLRYSKQRIWALARRAAEVTIMRRFVSETAVVGLSGLHQAQTLLLQIFPAPPCNTILIVFVFRPTPKHHPPHFSSLFHHSSVSYNHPCRSLCTQVASPKNRVGGFRRTCHGRRFRIY